MHFQSKNLFVNYFFSHSKICVEINTEDFSIKNKFLELFELFTVYLRISFFM